MYCGKGQGWDGVWETPKGGDAARLEAWERGRGGQEWGHRGPCLWNARPLRGVSSLRGGLKTGHGGEGAERMVLSCVSSPLWIQQETQRNQSLVATPEMFKV